MLHRVNRIGTWPTVSLLLLLMWACQLGFSWRRERLGVADLLDVRQWYTPDQAASLFDRLGEAGRQVYAVTEVSLDVVFPLAYGLLFAILLSKVIRTGRLWVLLPLGAAAADVLENITIATLAWTFDGGPTSLAWRAASFTALKSALLLLSLVALLFASIRALALPRGEGG